MRTSVLGLLVTLAHAGCADTTPPPTTPTQVAPSPTPAPPTPLPVAPAGPSQHAPLTELAPYQFGNGELMLRGDDLYWGARWVGDEPSFALCGGSLDCEKTRGALRSVSRYGGEHRTVLRMKDWPWDMQIAGEHLYWVGSCTAELWRAPLAGGDPERVLAGPRSVHGYRVSGDRVFAVDRFSNTPGVFVAKVGETLAELAGHGQKAAMLAVDGEHLFVAFEKGSEWEVHALGHDGRAPRVLGLVDELPLAAELRRSVLLVRGSSALVAFDTVTSSRRLLAPFSPHPDRSTMAADARHVFWANRNGTIGRVRIAGGDVEEAVVGGQPSALAVDATSIYWLDRERRQVMRIGRATLAWKSAATPADGI